MRHSYIVSYDICDAKRLRQVLETVRGYGDHLQYSVFRCDLNPTERLQLRDALSKIIHHLEDQVLFIDLGPEDGRARLVFESLGRDYLAPERQAIIV